MSWPLNTDDNIPLRNDYDYMTNEDLDAYLGLDKNRQVVFTASEAAELREWADWLLRRVIWLGPRSTAHTQRKVQIYATLP